MILYHGDCLVEMDKIADKSIDLIVCDPPYGVTRNSWDTRVDTDAMWKQFNRVIKDNGCVLVFSTLPFGVDIINANRKYYKYEWIWEKQLATGFLNAKKQPMRCHENILVFYKKQPVYNIVFEYTGKKALVKKDRGFSQNYNKFKRFEYRSEENGKRYPRDVVRNPQELFSKKLNHTQKPLNLIERMIQTYTNVGGGGA